MNAHVQEWRIQHDIQSFSTGTGRVQHMSVGWRSELRIELRGMPDEQVRRLDQNEIVRAIEHAIEDVFKPVSVEDTAPINEVLPPTGRKIVL